MAFDPGLAQSLRDALADHPITEKKMFGGLAFLLHGHMVCGVHKGGAMVRSAGITTKPPWPFPVLPR
jgi:hypothetical protein